MASYFDEHNCQELQSGQTPDHFLHFSRFLLHGGYWEVIESEFAQLYGFGDKPPPPASKKCVEELEKFSVRGKDGQCYVCLKDWKSSGGEEGLILPCSHNFHSNCILPWLNKTNSCPVCRYELPTDDEDYEEYRRQKKRKKGREEDLEVLHNSMFS